jgi:guanylate kinase
MSSDPAGQGKGQDSGSRRGLMFILSSPSGAGKTTLTRMLLDVEGESCRLSISATTRPPRPGEVNGQHYVFLGRETFEAQREAGAFLEWAEVFGNLYGTPKAPIEETLRAGRDVIFDIDWQGARQLAENAPEDVVRVFVLPPSRRALEERLKRRAADSADVVARRLAAASAEMSHWNEYDYVIINQDLAESLGTLRTILAAERMKRSRSLGLGAFVDGLISGQV